MNGVTRFLAATLAFTALAAQAYEPSAETVGAWVFTGAVGTECTGVTPNLVAGSDLVCETVVSNNESYVSPPAVYISDKPSALLWSDCGQTNLIANLSGSLRLQTSGESPYAGSFLRIPHFGQMIATCPDDSFTVELIVRQTADKAAFITGMTGIAATNTPAVAQTGYYICAPTNTAANVTNIDKLQPRSTATTQYTSLREGVKNSDRTIRDGNWHHLAYSWDGSKHQFMAWYDYCRARDSYDIVHPSHLPLGYDANSYWQIGGSLRWEETTPVGCGSEKGFQMDVVAVRVSKGILSTAQYMKLEPTTADRDVVARFNFEKGPVGGTFGYTREANLADASLIGLGLFPNVVETAHSYNLYTNFTWMAGVQEGGLVRRSTTSMWSGPSASNKDGLALDMSLPPRFREASDFTVEAIAYPQKFGERCLIFREHETATNRLTTASGTWAYANKNDWGSWGLGYRDSADNLYLGLLQEDDVSGAVTNVYNASKKMSYSGALSVGKMAYGQWHHLAVTYDRSKTNTFRVYVDYQVVHEVAFPQGQHLYRTTQQADPHLQFFGRGWNDNGSSLHGCVQDIRVTCRALSPEEFLKPSAMGLILIFR